jgi:hypothetical protein
METEAPKPLAILKAYVKAFAITALFVVALPLAAAWVLS